MCAACVEAPHAFLYLLLLFVVHVIERLIIVGVPPISFSGSTRFCRGHTRASYFISVCVCPNAIKEYASNEGLAGHLTWHGSSISVL